MSRPIPQSRFDKKYMENYDRIFGKDTWDSNEVLDRVEDHIKETLTRDVKYDANKPTD